MNPHWEIISRRGEERLVAYLKNGKMRKAWIREADLETRYNQYIKDLGNNEQ